MLLKFVSLLSSQVNQVYHDSAVFIQFHDVHVLLQLVIKERYSMSLQNMCYFAYHYATF